jgi:hypothetical protein
MLHAYYNGLFQYFVTEELVVVLHSRPLRKHELLNGGCRHCIRLKECYLYTYPYYMLRVVVIRPEKPKNNRRKYVLHTTRVD